jgi:hypothetical protein
MRYPDGARRKKGVPSFGDHLDRPSLGKIFRRALSHLL